MASTITLQSVIDLCSIHADLLPLTNVGGYTDQPALSLCNDALSEIINTDHDWKWNRVELDPHVQPLITTPRKQDYLFAGASAFTLGATSSGAAIALASANGITVSAGVVTVTTLEAHRFSVGDTVYMLGNGNAAYNSAYTDDGSSSSFSGGWAITAKTSTSFSFAATAGQNNSDVTGAPGISDFGWLSSASLTEINTNSSPPRIIPIKAERELVRWSQTGRPEKVCALSDLGTGVIKIRFYCVPGTTVYATSLVYQKSSPLKTALTQTWSPIPDQYSAVFRQALMYRMYRYSNSPQQTTEYQKLQQEILKALGADGAEESNVYLTPESTLMDYSAGASFGPF
jgi:hypothetical protein